MIESLGSILTQFKGAIRKTVKTFIPKSVIEARRRWLLRRSIKRVDQELTGKPVSEIFSEIYRRQLWGQPGSDRRFSSGHGSSLDLHVTPFVEATREFVGGLSWKPSVVDLGCGDFNVGSRIRECFGRYIACDVASAVLEENKARYASLDVDFVQLDMIEDEFPEGDICIIRQVLQHLSNADISRVVRKLGGYKILILTEPLPRRDFVPNLDQPTGVSSRLARGLPSGVVLTDPPFSLHVKSSQVLCTTFDDFSHSQLVTTAYWLQ
ncbi:MAG: class I SAM-dependent methyltransferase [Actinomycetota bacterium]